jgi:hypothetical protein
MKRLMTERESSDPVRSEFAFIARDCRAIAAHRELPDDSAEVLMPLEAIAKAILVEANGLLAYWKATGLGPQRNKS